mmetsp:Transcript_7103/g.12680  ORF Transcript_7103/g.12680 Transcript_7103/m.12680 type:complete len:93 (-) Transcript_7103:590-868(-)
MLPTSTIPLIVPYSPSCCRAQLALVLGSGYIPLIVPYSPSCCRASKCLAVVEVLIRIKMWSVGIDLFAKSLENVGACVFGHDITQVDIAGYI